MKTPSSSVNAGLSTRLEQWWEGIPFLTSRVVIVCGILYLVCRLVGYHSFTEVCFWPSKVISRFQVYRIFTSVLFHGVLLSVLMNLLAFVSPGSELERTIGSIRLLYLMILLATVNAILNILTALLAVHNPFHSTGYFMHGCGLGFSRILFSMIVIETHISGVESRSVFGIFNVPAKWYAWILLLVFKLFMPNVPLLGHLCGIMSGFAYSFGLFNVLMPRTSMFSAVESSPWMATLVRRTNFVLCSSGNNSGDIPTHTSQSPISNMSNSGNLWRNFLSWMPHRETSEVDQLPTQNDSSFPGRGRTLASSLHQTVPSGSPNPSLQTKVLDNSSSVDHSLQSAGNLAGPLISEGRHVSSRQPVEDSAAAAVTRMNGHQVSAASGAKFDKLVAMGFEKTQVEVALAAAEGDLIIAFETLMSQQ